MRHLSPVLVDYRANICNVLSSQSRVHLEPGQPTKRSTERENFDANIFNSGVTKADWHAIPDFYAPLDVGKSSPLD